MPMTERKLTRRGFIGFLGKFAFAGAILSVLGKVDTSVDARRPPGAVSESLFASVCVRCGECANVCPQKIITLLPFSAGLRNAQTPVLTSKGVCTRDLACIEVCPSGALQQITSKEFKIGTAVIDEAKCRNCGLCMPTCREIVDAIKWTADRKKVYIESDTCIGCGACIPDCPWDAIYVSGANARRASFKWG